MKFKQNLNQIIIVLAVVLVWRGTWGLADIYLFPNQPVLSFSISIIAGLALLTFIDFKKKDFSELE